MQNIKEELEELLKKDSRLTADGKLMKNKVVELAHKLDKDLLKLLMCNETIKKHFFEKIGRIFVFDKVKFQDFVSLKEFLADSYTRYKSTIGIQVNGDYLSNNNVALVWPYKDCVLEGGRTKDERESRKEIFWNETLALDDITRLLSPKVFTNLKRYDKNGETALSGKVDFSMGNLIIKGNNLLVLHSLKVRFAGKVKLIYIDPPYNTETDDFCYNDNFNHSTWMTFMKNRLEIAKSLLTDDGSIFISIDENEVGYLQIIMDEVFHRENRANLISVKRGSVTGHKTINPGVVNVIEYVMVYSKDKNLWKPNRLYKKRDRNTRYSNFVLNRDKSPSKWKFCTLLEAFSDFKGIKKSRIKRELGPIFESELFKFIKANANAVIQLAYPDIDKVSKELQELIVESESKPTKVFLHKREKELDVYLRNGQRLLFYADRLKEMDGEIVTVEPLSDIWDDVLPNDLHNEGGVKLKKGKKPEKLIGRIIELASNKGDIVMDFHVGSGTSAGAAIKLERRFIGIEQLDYGKNDSVVRLKNTINGEQAGISKATKWKGGGSFVHCELAKDNARFIDKIETAKNTKSLKTIWKAIQLEGFISYRVDEVKVFDGDKEENLNNLTMDEQKQILIRTLDLNQLYVNYSEIDDKRYKVSKKDKELNKQFYTTD